MKKYLFILLLIGCMKPIKNEGQIYQGDIYLKDVIDQYKGKTILHGYYSEETGDNMVVIEFTDGTTLRLHGTKGAIIVR